MKKILITLTLFIGLVITPICNHKHSEYCGYDETTQTGCSHEHNEHCNKDNSYELKFCDPKDFHC